MNTFPGEALEQLLLTADGFEIPGVGVIVRDAGSLAGVADMLDADGHPNAVWFAADARGNGYAVIPVAGWRDAAADDAIRITGGQSPGDAPIIGSLPAVVVAWLEGKQP